MAQAIDTKAAPADVVRDYDEICRVVQLFIEGEANGDVAKLKEAFHDGAQMFGSALGSRYDMPITEFMGMAASEPGDTGRHRARVVMVHQSMDAAMAVVAEEGYWGSLSFVDYLSLARIDGTWKIVCKLFAHTGGEMPPHGS